MGLSDLKECGLYYLYSEVLLRNLSTMERDKFCNFEQL